MTPERSVPGSGSPEHAYQPPQRRGDQTDSEPMRTARQAAQHMIDELENIAARLAAEPQPNSPTPPAAPADEQSPGQREPAAHSSGGS
jgi:hypothetical protein